MKKKVIQPPRLADQLLEWYCDPYLLEDLQGDFYERFEKRLKHTTPFKAKMLYWWDVIRFFKPYTINKNKNGLHPSALFMLGNYIKIAFRGLQKEKVNALVSIAGLGLGLCSFILISLYVHDEFKYDRYLPNADRIYRITTSYVSATSSEHTAWGEPSVGPIAKEKYGEIESYTSLVNENITVKSATQTHLETDFYYSDKNYFKVFPYEFISGSPNAYEHNTIVLTEKAANKYFGDKEALGQSLKVSNKDFQVVGIIENLPVHTDLKFDAIMAIDNLAEISGWTFNFLLFKEGADPTLFQPKLDQVFAETLQIEFEDYDTKGQYHMEALPDVHFGTPKLFDTPKSSKANLYLFSSIAVLILLVAGINHVNITLAEAAKRQSEVGIRKVIGAQSHELSTQFITKSLVISLISLLLALIMAVNLIPLLNLSLQKSISAYSLLSSELSMYIGTALILLVIISGGYPAFYLSRLNPVRAIQGAVKLSSKKMVMRGLMITQFVVSLGLIVGAVIISNQLQLIQNKSENIFTDRIMVIDVPYDKTVVPYINQLKEELKQFPFVKATSATGFNSWPTSDMDIDTYEVQSNGEWKVTPFNNIEVDEGYATTLNLTFLEGRNFSKEETTGRFEHVIVNKALVDQLGWDNPLEEVVAYEGGVESQVIGVVDNFHFNSIKDDFEPMLIFPDSRYLSKLLVKISGAQWMDEVEQIELKWRSSLQDQPFEFRFLQDHIQNQYEKEYTMRSVFNFFVVIAISIACLGLFGLLSLTTINRLKELGIRKVMGAKPSHLWLLVSKEYIILIGIATIIAVPICTYILSGWLDGFIYKTPLSLLTYLKGIGMLMGIAILTMSYHIIKAISINPTQVLNHE